MKQYPKNGYEYWGKLRLYFLNYCQEAATACSSFGSKFQNAEVGKLPIIGVGGIMCAEDAREKLEAGANLVQVYTGLVYTAPGLVKNIVRGLVDDL